jgi:hypothetical protein
LKCCPGCGGPLYSRKCLGLCASGIRFAESVRKPANASQPTERRDSGVSRIEWQGEFRSAKGQPQDVLTWRLYRVTHTGLRVLIWEPGMRWPQGR